jgi:phytoene dehydrogenase-like protein
MSQNEGLDYEVIVIGAGHNGLVAATYLARSDLDVAVFERQPNVGGACVTEELWPGFQFSTCAHMIHGFHPKLIRDMGLSERGLDVIEKGPSIKLLPDGSYYGPDDLESSDNRRYTRSERERKATQEFEEFLSTLKQIFAPYRLRKPPTMEQLREEHAGSAAWDNLQLALENSVYELHDRFLPTENLREEYADQAAAVGEDPSGLYLGYLAHDQPDESGVEPPNGYVRGGMGVVTELLAEAAREAGVTIHLDREVDRIPVEDGRSQGVRLADGTDITGQYVVSSLDPKATFLGLIAPDHLENEFRDRIKQLTTEISCMKFLAVIDELPDWQQWDGDPELAGEGTVRIGTSRDQIRSAYADLEAGRPPRTPVVSVSVPSTLDDSLTQAGYHTASIWIFPAPAELQGTTWEAERDPVADDLVEFITDYAPNFRSSIVESRLRTPADIERENSLTDGCIWHVQHHGEHMFWNRPLPELAEYRAPVRDLYLCGAGQHPGGEVTGLPGHNAAHELLKDI